MKGREIVEKLKKDLGVEIHSKIPIGDEKSNYSIFGAAAGVISGVAFYNFLSENSGALNLIYKSGHFIATNWGALQFAWETKQSFDISFVDAVKNIHEAHNFLDAIDAGFLLDHVDFLGDAIDGITSFGVGIIASKGVKALGEKINKSKQDKKDTIEKKVRDKAEIVKNIKARCPPHTLSKYFELPIEARRL